MDLPCECSARWRRVGCLRAALMMRTLLKEDQAATSKTTLPETMVVTGAPLSFQPAKGVLRLLEANSCGLISTSFSVSRMITSPSEPSLRVPLFVEGNGEERGDAAPCVLRVRALRDGRRPALSLYFYLSAKGWTWVLSHWAIWFTSFSPRATDQKNGSICSEGTRR